MSKYFLMLILAFVVSCKSKKKSNNGKQNNNNVVFTPVFTPGPPTLVYKTKGDYANLVPVTLSDDKTMVVAYPHSSDLQLPGQRPLLLHNGYLLDNRGVGLNTGFLNISYEDYIAANDTFKLSTLYNMLLDKDPFTEVCDCGNRTVFENVEQQLNEWIELGKLTTVCTKIK